MAKTIPVQRAGSSPGPVVTAIASILFLISFSFILASLKTFSKTRGRFLMCSLFASAGKTPPYSLCMSICEETSFASILNFIFLSFSVTFIIAIAVSSQEVSIASIFIRCQYIICFFI